MSSSNGTAAVSNGTTGTEAVLSGLQAPDALGPAKLVLTREQIRDLNIHQRIAEIKKRCVSLPKKQTNEEEGWAYAGHDQVIDLLRGLMAEFRVNVYQEPLEFTINQTVADLILNKVHFEYDVVNADVPDDKFTKHNFGLCYGVGDKAYNKCSTISEKYFLLRLFNIATFDDPDANASPVSHESRSTLRGPAGGGSEAKGTRSPNDCEECGNPITFFRKDDQTLTKEAIVKLSLKDRKKKLCGRCLFGQPSNSKSAAAAGEPGPEAESGLPAPSKTSPPGSGS